MCFLGASGTSQHWWGQGDRASFGQPLRGIPENTAGRTPAWVGKAEPGLVHSGAARAAVLGNPREKVANRVRGLSPARRVPSRRRRRRRRALGHLAWAEEAPGPARRGTRELLSRSRERLRLRGPPPFSVLPERRGNRPAPASAPASPGRHGAQPASRAGGGGY